MKRSTLLLLVFVTGAAAFRCSPDSILTWASEKRAKQLERECHLESQNDVCATKDDVEKAWKDFTDISIEYEKAVKECRAAVAAGRGLRAVDDDPDDGTIDHTGHNHKRRSTSDDKEGNEDEEKNSGDCEGTSCSINLDDLSRKKRECPCKLNKHDPNDPNIDHTGHNHKRRHADHRLHKRACGCMLKDEDRPSSESKREERSADHHDPNDSNVDHTGHNHKRRSADDHDPNDPNVDHTGHNHRMRRDHHHGKDNGRHQPDDPMDDSIDHTGHNHRRRSAADHDPNDPNVDHTGHNHKKRRASGGHHPDDCNDKDAKGDHSGHNHRRRRHHSDPIVPQSNDEEQENKHSDPISLKRSSRGRRQTCMSKGREELEKLSTKYKDHCERENICLPDEDLKGDKAAKFKSLHGERAKKYAKYIGALSVCYGKL